MLTKRAQVLCEQETTGEGQAETLVVGDAFLVSNPTFTPVIDMNERNPVSASLSPYVSIPGRRSARMTFDVELVGSDQGAGTALYFSDALIGCGADEDLSGTAIYHPAADADALKSVTLALYMDGKIYKMWGARGNFRLLMVHGQPAVISFEFTAADWSVTDGGLLSPTYNAAIAPIFTSASLQIDSYDAIISQVEIDTGNVVSLRPSANASSGHLSAVITGRKPTFSFDPEEVLVASEDFFGNWRAGKPMAFTASFGTGSGYVITVEAPAVQYSEVAMAERDGQSTLDITALLTRDTADDEWKITIT
jgi:hypothetical protein